uniref:Uncharacterized protein n=1 Tax=Cacopsylla melanoneura TaxID=428564 RepID=A0A8D8SD76_9HEMI
MLHHSLQCGECSSQTFSSQPPFFNCKDAVAPLPFGRGDDPLKCNDRGLCAHVCFNNYLNKSSTLSYHKIYLNPNQWHRFMQGKRPLQQQALCCFKLQKD